MTAPEGLGTANTPWKKRLFRGSEGGLRAERSWRPLGNGARQSPGTLRIRRKSACEFAVQARCPPNALRSRRRRRAIASTPGPLRQCTRLQATRPWARLRGGARLRRKNHSARGWPEDPEHSGIIRQNFQMVKRVRRRPGALSRPHLAACGTGPFPLFGPYRGRGIAASGNSVQADRGDAIGDPPPLVLHRCFPGALHTPNP